MWALQWKDIDLEKGVVHFYKAMRKSESSYNVSDGTKTGYKGVRTLPLGNTLLEMLTALRRPLEGQETASLRVFTGPRGEQINKDRFKSLWEKIEESLGLPPGPTFYSLKHLGNSFLASQNVNSEARAKRMGHTTDKMAKDVYRIDIPDENMQVVSVFDNQFKKESK
jgi:integrase